MMNSKTGRIATALGAGLVLSAGLLINAAPAAADPPRHAPAVGYRRKVVRAYAAPRKVVRTYVPRSRYSYAQDIDRDGIPNWRDRDKDGDGRRNRYDDHKWRPRSANRWGVKKDWDRDGIRNSRDRDRDNDGIRNRRDRDKDGDGVRNRRDDHKRNPRRR